MSLPELPRNQSPREMRKALIRLRMEMHRQEIRHESHQLLEPLRRMRGLGHHWQERLGIRHAPLWGIAVVTLLGFFGGKGVKGAGVGSLSRLVRLGGRLLPLIRLVMQGTSGKP